VTHDWSFVIDGHFLELRTRSLALPDSALHEDVAYLSLDTDRDAFVFRQFLSEGFVNTYDVRVEAGDPGKVLFAYRECESAGGMRAQLRLSFVSEDEYVMTLDLATDPEGEFRPCQEMRMRRVR